MFELTKSVNYTLRRDRLVRITFLTLLVLPFLAMYISGMFEGVSFEELTASAYLINIGSAILEFFLFATMILSAKAVGGDSGDKTMNYELSSGHSRASVYWTRILNGVVWSVILVVAMSWIPYGVLTIVNGWGVETAPREVMLRLFLSVFPLLRFAGGFMLVTSLVDSAEAGIAVGYAIVLVETILDGVLETVDTIDRTYLFGISNLGKVLDYKNSWEYVENKKAITWYDFSSPIDLIIGTIAVSAVLAAIYVTLGYVVFKKRDRR